MDACIGGWLRIVAALVVSGPHCVRLVDDRWGGRAVRSGVGGWLQIVAACDLRASVVVGVEVGREVCGQVAVERIVRQR